MNIKDKNLLDNVLLKEKNQEQFKEQTKDITNKKDLIIEEIIKSLPKFKYHPNLYNSRMVTFRTGVCQCCEKEVRAYIETMYSKDDVDCICLHCVANGRAANKFNGSFISDAEEINNSEAIEELYSRTPGYYSWQGEYWLACCNEYCEKHSDYKDIDWLKDKLTARGEVAGYLFKCKKFGKNPYILICLNKEITKMTI